MELITLNPWWENASAIELDKHINALRRFKYTYRPLLMDEDFKTGNLYTIRGPRQIGKTTFLKLFIQEKLKIYPKESIFYWSCDNLVQRNDLIELLQEYADFCRVKGVEPRYILLDEITGIADWQRSIKFIIDNDITPNACFILTGSNAMDLRKGSERLPGRRGKHGRDLFILPLTFREYAGLMDPAWYSRHKDDGIDELKVQDRTLRTLFEKYLVTGGIPLVINEYEMNEIIPNYIFDLYYSWIVGDVLKEGKNEQSLKELMKSILISYSTPVSWDSLAKRSSIKSHVTISSYVEVLSNIFVTIPCFFFDISGKKVDFNKNKKIYIFDPFILRIFSERLNVPVDKERVVEGLVGAHLKRKNILEDIYYTQLKKETDFVTVKGDGLEVKYQKRISKEDFRNRRYFKRFTLLSQETYWDDTLPVHTFLFLERS